MHKGRLGGPRLTVGTADDCTIFSGGWGNIWSKFRGRRGAMVALGELDPDGRHGAWIAKSQYML
uniref:Uncharacterized protein n=1 Tax=Romanomermis culicivorax TaxID=13658 RepID=A0A915JGH7_ROMCU